MPPASSRPGGRRRAWRGDLSRFAGHAPEGRRIDLRTAVRVLARNVLPAPTPSTRVMAGCYHGSPRNKGSRLSLVGSGKSSDLIALALGCISASRLSLWISCAPRTPKQYEIAEVRTSRGVCRAMLFPKATQAAWRPMLALTARRWLSSVSDGG
jgi:hypothetical protein